MKTKKALKHMADNYTPNKSVERQLALAAARADLDWSNEVRHELLRKLLRNGFPSRQIAARHRELLPARLGMVEVAPKPIPAAKERCPFRAVRSCVSDDFKRGSLQYCFRDAEVGQVVASDAHILVAVPSEGPAGIFEPSRGQDITHTFVRGVKDYPNYRQVLPRAGQHAPGKWQDAAELSARVNGMVRASHFFQADLFPAVGVLVLGNEARRAFLEFPR